MSASYGKMGEERCRWNLYDMMAVVKMRWIQQRYMTVSRKCSGAHLATHGAVS